MRKIPTIWLLLVWVALMLFVIVSCGPAARQHRKEQKLARLIKENPGLVTHDTIFKDTTAQPDSIHETFQADVGPDLWPVDSLTGYFEGKVQPDILDSLNKGIKSLMEHSGDMDTTFETAPDKKTGGKTKVHVRREGKKLTVDVDVVPDPVKIKVPVAVTNINPPAALTWYETMFLHVGKTFGVIGFCLIGLLILYTLYRILRKI
jgi:hypothetical protein